MCAQAMSPPRPPQMSTTPVPPPMGFPLIEESAASSAAPLNVSQTASQASGFRLPSAGEQFDKYTLLAKLATGGMAELFVAELSGAAGFSKKVVIKRILPHVAHDEHFTRMFLDEAMTCAQINHPNVCQVFELCETQGTHFLVLEHLEGATVGELIRRSLVSEQQLNLPLTAGIIVQACDGLHAAHEQVDEDGRNSNLVHRDVSPGNLFVTVDGIVKVLDFGIAKARWMSRKTKTGTLLGKCEYMSPEQARGGVTLDRRSDIFSLGIIAWELVCGKRLFRRESEYETLRAVLRSPIESPRSLRPSVPRAVDEAIMRALERAPDDRFRTAYEFRQAIAEALRETGGPTPMCDIAPLIRSSFSEELRIQRAVLKQAARQADGSGHSLPRLGSLPPMNDGDENFANTDVLTSQHQRLPSMEEEVAEGDSVELTFRDVPTEAPDDMPLRASATLSNPTAPPPIPHRPSKESKAVALPQAKLDSPQQDDLAVGETPPKRRTSRAPAPSAALPSAALPSAALPSAARRMTAPVASHPAASHPAASHPAVSRPAVNAAALMRASTEVIAQSSPKENVVAAIAPIDNEVKGQNEGRSTVVLLALTLLLGAAVTTGSLIYFSKKSSQSQASLPPAQAAAVTPPSSSTPLPSSDTAQPKEAPAAATAVDAGAPRRSAVANAAARAQLLEANQKAKAVVTALPASDAQVLGSIEILSTEVGTVYLYPEKTVLGTTPLTVALPAGRHKLKLEIGPTRAEKKYFFLKVEADQTTTRKFTHW
mgnify:FL=1